MENEQNTNIQGEQHQSEPISPQSSTPPPFEPSQEIPNQPLSEPTKNSFSFPSIKREYLIIGGILILIAFIAGILFYTSSGRHVAVKQFTNVYSFVPEKISKSAVIQINVPEGVDEQLARSSITFSPELKGDWQTEEIEGVILFKPQKPLKEHVYYAVNMDTGSVQMSGDFYVDDDPTIEAIFPGEGSESHEDSEITIVFNRPMVPLTTLSEQESVDLPITISPETPGKFKWISTRNLQFIPDTTLIPSSDYTVKVDEGLYSLDGLAVAPVTHSFVTRPLRYESVSSDYLGYRSPIAIRFNQPVDIDKTEKLISVNKSGGDSVSIEVEYGESTYYDYDKGKYITESDPSVLHVYQKKDMHGRNRLWDFDTTYDIVIEGGVPLVGNKDLTIGKRSTVSVPNIVKSVNASSDRSSYVSTDLFDPQGKLIVTFHEDVDKNRSTIKAKGLKGIAYGERCQTDEEGNEVRVGSGCVKEDDKSMLIFTFDANAFGTGETFQVELRKMETPEGFKINADPIYISATTYPTFQILSTTPSEGSSYAELDGLYVCSNVPLKNPGEEGLSSYIQTDGYIVYGNWSRSRLVHKAGSYDTCGSGEYQTQLRYGLLPQTNYSMNLNLRDEFDQSASKQINFKTEAPQENYVRFHNMQQQYNVTPPERTKLTYAVENMEHMDMHICKLSAENFLKQTINRPSRSTPPSGSGCTQVVSKQIPLPARYWVTNYFQVNLEEYFADTRGHYIITFSNPLYTESYYDYTARTSVKRQAYDRTYVSATNLAVGKKEVEFSDSKYRSSNNPNAEDVLNDTIAQSSNLYWVIDNNTLQPVMGASVTQYEEDGNGNVNRLTTGSTDYQGVARASVHEDLQGAVIQYGLESAVVTDWADTMQRAGSARDASRTYIYTDRPIYRPGHTVHIKGIDRIGFDGSYEILSGGTVDVNVYDAQGKKVYDVSLQQNMYGTFSTSFDIPEDAPLGSYRIEAFGQSTRFDVEEYVPAAFKLETTSDKEEYISGETMKLNVQADYYFGVPLNEGTVSYSVTAQDYYFDKYTDEYFNFGSGWYYCYWCDYGDDFLFRGETNLNEKGSANIERELNLSDFFSDATGEKSKLVTVSITVKDTNGRSVSKQQSFVLHKGEFYIGAKTDDYYTGTNQPTTLRVKTVDTNGEGISLSGIEKKIYKVSWETYKRQEVDGGYYYKSEKKLDEVSSEKIKTNNNGDWSGQISFEEEGQYEVHIQKEDARGNIISTITRVYIYGSRAVSVPPNNNYELDVESEKQSLDVGDIGTLLIKSPYENAKALITIERGTVYDYWVVDITGGLYLHTFPIKSEYAPNIFASVLLFSDDPETKYGSLRYEIGIEEHELDVKVTPHKSHYLPGEEVTLFIETRSNTGQLIPAEVSLAVADLSVLALKGNPKKDPAMFFYDGFPLSVTTASNIRNILYEMEIPLGTKGGGGGDPDDLAKKKRGVFKDTAFWSANVETDYFGKATVTFTLPDNLTTWQIEGVGVTRDTRLGVDYTEFTTKKDLMAVPLKPRFVVPGDSFSLGAKIFNQTDKGQEVSVALESDTLIFVGDKADSLFINEGESKTVYFDVVAPGDKKGGTHTFTFTAQGGDFIDSVEQQIAITPNTTYETVATANFTKNAVASEYIYIPDEVISGDGGLTINANATLAVFTVDALKYMVTYPYGCSEQLSSALSTIATVKHALTLPNVEGDLDTIEYHGEVYSIDEVIADGLSQIYEAQTTGGGFAYYKGLYPSLFLTVHVVDALTNLRDAGYEIPEDVLRRATAYIERETKRVYGDYPDSNKETVIISEYTIQKAFPGEQTGLSTLVESLVNDKAFLNEKISSMTLAYFAILTAEGYSRSSKNDVYDALKNRIDIDGRGAYLSSIATARSNYYETTIKNTGLLLKVFAAHDDEHPAMGNVLRWLLASRDDKGVWGGTNNTFVVIDGMIDYLTWQKETESHFSFKGLLHGVEIFDYEFKPSNVFETFTHFIGIDEFEREKLIPLSFEKENKTEQDNNMYYDMALKYFLPVDELPPRDEGVTITRDLYALDDEREQNPIVEAQVGDVVKGKLTITVPSQYTHVAIEDIIPAGFEIVNFNLDTEDQSLKDNSVGASSESWFSRIGSAFGGSQSAQLFRSRGFGGSYGNNTRTLRPTHTESHDDRVFLYVEKLSPGVYEYEYYLRALVPGEFQHLPARAEELYFPEVFGRTDGDIVTVTPAP